MARMVSALTDHVSSHVRNSASSTAFWSRRHDHPRYGFFRKARDDVFEGLLQRAQAQTETQAT
jgi:hypothetical protein